MVERFKKMAGESIMRDCWKQRKKLNSIGNVKDLIAEEL